MRKKEKKGGRGCGGGSVMDLAIPRKNLLRFGHFPKGSRPILDNVQKKDAFSLMAYLIDNNIMNMQFKQKSPVEYVSEEEIC